MRRAWLGEEGEDVLSSGGFLGWSDGIFEVVGYRVYGKAARFLEESGRGGWNFDKLVGVEVETGEGGMDIP